MSAGVRALVLCAVLGAGAAAGCEPEPPQRSRFVQAPRTEPRERRMIPAEWDTAWVHGGPQDTLLSGPGFMDASAEGVFLFDYIDQRLLAFDPAGALRWTFGRRGRGPAEFTNVRDIVVGTGGTVDLLDPENGRITRLDREGRLAGHVPLGAVGAFAAQMVPLPGRGFLLMTTRGDSSLVTVDSLGRVTGRREFPWPGYAALGNISRQGFTAGDGDAWIYGFALGDGWFVTGPARSTAHGYVEHLEFPELVTERRQRGVTVTRKARYHPCTACSLDVSGTTLSVLFGGYSRDAHRVVDEYRWTDGRYLGSRALPRRADLIAVHGGTYYVVVEDPAPRLLALRPRGDAA